MNETNTAEVTEAQISAWKTRYPQGVFLIEIDGKKGYIRSPSDSEMFEWIRKSKAIKKINAQSAIPLGVECLNKFWLGGDSCIKKEVSYRNEALNQLTVMGEHKLKDMEKRGII